MAIQKAYKAIGKARQQKMRTAMKTQVRNSKAKSERRRKALRKKTWGF
jgi:hypothetical protein